MLGTAPRNRTLLAIGMLACLGIFWWLGSTMDVPYDREGTVSLLQQPNPLVAILTVAIGLAIATLVATLVTSIVHTEAGLFCAAFGLSAISMRGRSIRYALFAAQSRASVFLLLALELLLLAAAIGTLWWLVTRAFANRYREETGLGAHDDDPLDQKVMATSAHVLTMLIVLSLLNRADAKTQVLATVGLASFLGVLGAALVAPVRSSAWYLLGPLVTGLIGYLSSFVSPSGIEIGQLHSYLAPLARPMPLDYASFGVAGVLLGIWVARSWQPHEEGEVPGTAVAGLSTED